MIFKAIPSTRSRFAVLLLAVFLGSLLVKPVHSFFSNHEHAAEISCSSLVEVFPAEHHSDCPICDYEFCFFLPQDKIDITAINKTFRIEKANKTVGCLSNVYSHIYQLRAPPAL